jgi:single-stranded-DNA-specific exonuclease
LDKISQKILRRERPDRVIAGIQNPLLEKLFRARGVSNAGEVSYSLAKLLPPVKLGGIDEASALLAEAVQAGARILLVGDFDADGATSCALAVRALRAMGVSEVGYLVPNRFRFGY